MKIHLVSARLQQDSGTGTPLKTMLDGVNDVQPNPSVSSLFELPLPMHPAAHLTR